MKDISGLVKNHRFYNDYQIIVNRLADFNYVCWLAGGAVRDFLCGIQVNEFDLVTDATTDNLKKIFPEAILVGESFGVIKIPMPSGVLFDLATFRSESDYKDGRRPTLVNSSVPNLDAQRRDFTVNALFWSAELGVVDYMDGYQDINNLKLRCVGEPDLRFNEDYLRMIRLLRFYVNYPFTIDRSTKDSAIKNINKINQITGERLWSEFKKINSAEAWKKGLVDDLFIKVIELTFDSKVDERLSKTTLTDNFIINLGLIFKIDLSKILKQKFKVSNLELKKYQCFYKILKNLISDGVEELLYEIENSELSNECFEVLKQNSLLDPVFAGKVSELKAQHPSYLVNPMDILSLVPKHMISYEIKAMRLNQLRNFYKNKEEVLAVLNEKYANFFEKS